MLKARFFAGGEIPFDPRMILERRRNEYSAFGDHASGYQKYYTFGGYSSIRAIVKDLAIQPGESILLPSYLCPTIIDAVKASGCGYSFYRLVSGLVPDWDDILARLTSVVRAVFFIDYFGFSLGTSQDDPRMNPIRSRSVIIQDMVQAWVSDSHELYGDYCFNSVRKYTPFEGSVILSKSKMDIDSSAKSTWSHALTKRLGQFIRYCYLKYGVFSERMFLDLINRSHASYHQDQISGDLPLNHFMLDRYDFAAQGRRRKRVYDAIKASMHLSEIVTPPEGTKAIPLGLGIKLENREEIRKKLAAKGVYCPIHWNLSDEISKNEYPTSWEISQTELTLPLSVDLQYLDRYIQILREVIK